MTYDQINACFELAGAYFIMRSCWAVQRDREVRGVSWEMPLFFGAWGVWNLAFYPAVGAPWSFVAGVTVVVANLSYLSLLLYFTRWPDPHRRRAGL